MVASEVGVVDLDETQITTKGRLGPGQMLALDTTRRVLLHDTEIKAELARKRPYDRVGAAPSGAQSRIRSQR